MEKILDMASITLNKNSVPGECREVNLVEKFEENSGFQNKAIKFYTGSI